MKYLSDLVEFIKTWVQIKTGTMPGDNKDLFADQTFDSLAFAQLISAIEDEFSIEISFADVDDWRDITNPLGLANLITKSNG